MFTDKQMTQRERFINVMEYRPVDRAPNHEVGVWAQTKERWKKEGMNEFSIQWDWFTGDEYFEMDTREFFDVNFGMMPDFGYTLLDKTERYEIFRDSGGIVRKALIDGTVDGMRSSMDTYLSFPVENAGDFRELKKRYEAGLNGRYPAGWREISLPNWKNRKHVLILGRNCSTAGFYWRCREWMGTENLSYAFYDQPDLVREMMEFIADFTIETSKKALAESDFDYVMLSEDMSMKTGPLIGPESYKEFIYPHMRRLTDFYKSHGVKYVFVDTDGNCEALLPLLMDAGVDGIWPLERVAGMDPVRIREKFGKGLRLMGGVDKMEIAKGKQAIEKHLAALAPLIEEGGYIPTVDHLVSPEVSWEDFQYYMKRKMDLLSGRPVSE
ncbi:MAG: hypothetical protein FWC55_03805 [Firmicutes bacterium]|nr:hypothetical protein [Bacillota bacterium]